MLEEYFRPEFNEFDISVMWYRQNGVSCETAGQTVNPLKGKFGNRIIARNDAVELPTVISLLKNLSVYFSDIRFFDSCFLLLLICIIYWTNSHLLSDL